MVRSKKELRNAQDLPKWFNLKNYDTTKLDASGWYEQFSVRSEIYNILCREKHTDGKCFDVANEVLNKIYEKPIVSLSSEQKMWLFMLCPRYDHSHHAIIKKGSQNYFGEGLSVKSLTVFDLLREVDSMEESKRKVVKLYLAESEYPWTSLSKSEDPEPHEPRTLIDWFTDPISTLRDNTSPRGHTSMRCAIIDIDAPDAILNESFKRWIKKERENSTYKQKNYRMANFDKWTKLGLLPYADLTIWNTIKKGGITIKEGGITNKLMADAISSPSDSSGEEEESELLGEDNVRTTIFKNAKAMMGIDNEDTHSISTEMKNLYRQTVIERNEMGTMKAEE